MATGTNHTVSAPFNLTEVDRLLLSQTDEEFIPHSWNELKEIVGVFWSHRLLCFHRADD